ncbi:MAG: alkaline phosphatase family protein [Alphaproteobacteria bacterium]
MPVPTKVLFICIDSAEPDLVERWSESGDMPMFKSLKTKGAWARVSATPGFYSHAIWPSLFTGVSPARHGRYCSTQLEPGGYDNLRLTADDIWHDPFWNVLSRAGRKLAVINVPKAPLSHEINGVQLADWGVHDLEYSGPCSWPAEFAGETTARYGADTLGSCEEMGQRPDTVAGLRDGLLERIKTHGRFADELMAQGGWDLFLFAFADSHCIGHECWHVHDPDHPRHDAEFAVRIGDPIRDVYAGIDAQIARLFERAGPEATKIVFVGPGMEANHTANMLVDPILRKLDDGPLDTRRKLMRAARWGYGKMPGAIRKLLEGLARRAKNVDRETDRNSRSAFYVANHSGCGAIRVNLVGREPLGRVQPGDEFEAYCTALTADLMDIVNIVTGEKLVRRVIRTSDRYAGDHFDFLPDLLVEWNREAPIHGAASPKIGKIRRPVPNSRSGDHSSRCMVYCQGPGIAPGRIEQPVTVEDLAPTVAGLLGASLGDVDGKPFLALRKE